MLCLFLISRTSALLKKRYRYNGANNEKNANESPSNPQEEKINEIFQLNFDCLVHVISFLDLKDLANLDKASDNFKPITESSYKRYKSFDCNSIRPISIIEGRTVITQIGSYLTSISLTRGDFTSVASVNSFLNIAAVRCTELKDLYIESVNIDSMMLKKLNIFPRLKSIELIHCKIDDRIMECLETATFLEKLNLSENFNLNGRCMVNTMNLVSLNLDNCSRFLPSHFSNVCINNKCLVQLNIAGCNSLTPKSVNDISTNLLNLEELIISNCYCQISSTNLLEFVNLPKLTKLTIKFYNLANIDDLLLKFAEKDQLKCLDISLIQIVTKRTIEAIAQFDKLEILKMNFSLFSFDEYKWRNVKGNLQEMYLSRCYKVTADGLMKFVENTPHLSVLDIRGCIGITADFYYRISTFLKQQNRPQRLTVFADETRIFRYEILPEIIAENLPRIQLNFTKKFEFSSGARRIE